MTEKHHERDVSDTGTGIPAVVLDAAMENATASDEFAVVCTDGDIEYAQTREEAEQVAREMQAMREFFTGPSHETEILDLQL